MTTEVRTADRLLAGREWGGPRTLRANRVWCDADLAGVPTLDIPFVSVGGGLGQEAARIGWPQMAVRGHAALVRPRREGGFCTLVVAEDQSCSVVRSRYVHLGLGYPALRLVADLARYRALQGDSFSAVS